MDGITAIYEKSWNITKRRRCEHRRRLSGRGRGQRRSSVRPARMGDVAAAETRDETTSHYRRLFPRLHPPRAIAYQLTSSVTARVHVRPSSQVSFSLVRQASPWPKDLRERCLLRNERILKNATYRRLSEARRVVRIRFCSLNRCPSAPPCRDMTVSYSRHVTAILLATAKRGRRGAIAGHFHWKTSHASYQHQPILDLK